jgi:hypothetical protein
MASNETPQEAQAAKRIHIDNRYPTVDLKTAIEVTRMVHQHGDEWTLEELLDTLSGGLTFGGTQLWKVNAARFFGLLETTSCSVIATRLGRQIFEERAPNEAPSKHAEAFFSLPLFREIYRQCSANEGQLPSVEELSNTLNTVYGVPQHRAPLVAQIFMDSAQQAGLLDADSKRLKPRA